MLLPYERGMFAVTGNVYLDMLENWFMPQLGDEEIQGAVHLPIGRGPTTLAQGGPGVPK